MAAALRDFNCQIIYWYFHSVKVSTYDKLLPLIAGHLCFCLFPPWLLLFLSSSLFPPFFLHYIFLLFFFSFLSTNIYWLLLYMPCTIFLLATWPSIPVDIWLCLKTFLVVITWSKSVTGVETKDITKYLIRYRKMPNLEN